MRKLGDPYAAYSDKSVKRAVARVSRRAGTGRPYAYSNLGFGVLGRALAAAAGESFDTLVRSRVLRPLALTAMTFDVEAGAERLAGHDPRGQRVPDWHNRSLAGCGSLWSSIQDLYKYLFAHLEPAVSPLADAIDLVGGPRAPAGRDEQIALAWHITDTPQGPVHWHNGGTGGFASFIGFNPSARIGMAVLINRRHAPGQDAASKRLLTQLALGGGR
jgi:CubicO group peptidase (beta-lactamase class C family)